MKQAIVHVGTYKTASSSLQDTLFLNKDALLQSGVLYPSAGIPKDARRLGKRHRNLARTTRTRFYQSEVQRLLAEIRENEHHTLIVSSEAWSNLAFHDSLRHLVQELRRAGYDRVIGISLFRNIRQYCVSHYREFTFSQGNSSVIDDHVRRRRGTFDLLAVSKSLCGIFRGDIRFFGYDPGINMVDRLLWELHIYGFLKRSVSNRNVRRLGPIDIEIVRILNSRGFPGSKLFRLVGSEVGDSYRSSSCFVEDLSFDLVDKTDQYINDFQSVTKMDDGSVQDIFRIEEPAGFPVSEVRSDLEEVCRAWENSIFGRITHGLIMGHDLVNRLTRRRRSNAHS